MPYFIVWVPGSCGYRYVEGEETNDGSLAWAAMQLNFGGPTLWTQRLLEVGFFCEFDEFGTRLIQQLLRPGGILISYLQPQTAEQVRPNPLHPYGVLILKKARDSSRLQNGACDDGLTQIAIFCHCSQW